MGLPKRWLDYCPVGQRIPGTRFIAFKVPLKPSVTFQGPKSHSFDLWDLLDSVERQNQELGLIIDLTFTTKYYKLSDVPQSCCYIKISIEGHRVPSDAAILSFKRAVRQFLKENENNNKLIGVHCTHGLNRTGYLVCRYLIDVDGLRPAAALELFNSYRGHCIERKNYLDDLLRGTKRNNADIDKPETSARRGLAMQKLPQGAKSEGQLPETVTAVQTSQCSENNSAKSKQTNEKQSSGKRSKRRPKRPSKVDQKSCDRSGMDDLSSPP